MTVAYAFDHRKEIPPNLLFRFQLLLLGSVRWSGAGVTGDPQPREEGARRALHLWKDGRLGFERRGWHLALGSLLTVL